MAVKLRRRMNRRVGQKPEPHPGLAGLAIALLGLILAAVLEFLGVLSLLDVQIASAVGAMGLDGVDRGPAPWVPWGWAVLSTLGLCQAVLHVAETWRRAILVVATLLITLCWVPVMALAAYQPQLGCALVALLWGGGGSLVYAARHREPG